MISKLKNKLFLEAKNRLNLATMVIITILMPRQNFVYKCYSEEHGCLVILQCPGVAFFCGFIMQPKNSEKQFNLSGFQYGLAGAATGTLTRFLVQPLDVLKISFQLQVVPVKQKMKAKYTSVFQAVTLIFKEEGIQGLWKGHIPAQYLSIFFGAAQFSTFEVLTSYMHNTHPMYYTSFEHFVNISCGSVAGFTATVISFPFDVIKTHLVFQGEPKVYKGTIDAAIKIYKKEGPKGFTKGLTAACIQTAPMSGLIFCFHGVFSQLWFLFIDSDNKLKLSTTGSMTAGLLAGLCAKAIVYPFDLTKKRLQIQGFAGKTSKGMEIMKCSKIRDCFLLTVRNEGFLGLFKGFTPTLIKSGATTSLYFTIYEKICQLLQYSVASR